MEDIDIIGKRDKTLPALFVRRSIGSPASLLLLCGDAMAGQISAVWIGFGIAAPGEWSHEMTFRHSSRLCVEQPAPRNVITGGTLGLYSIAEKIVAVHPRADVKASFGLFAQQRPS